MSKEKITIPKDEYIELLRGKSELLKMEMTATEEAAFHPSKPHSWMSGPEKAEILKLANLGLRPSEIARKLGRSRSTVHRWIAASGGQQPE